MSGGGAQQVQAVQGGMGGVFGMNNQQPMPQQATGGGFGSSALTFGNIAPPVGATNPQNVSNNLQQFQSSLMGSPMQGGMQQQLPPQMQGGMAGLLQGGGFGMGQTLMNGLPVSYAGPNRYTTDPMVNPSLTSGGMRPSGGGFPSPDRITPGGILPIQPQIMPGTGGPGAVNPNLTPQVQQAAPFQGPNPQFDQIQALNPQIKPGLSTTMQPRPQVSPPNPQIQQLMGGINAGVPGVASTQGGIGSLGPMRSTPMPAAPRVPDRVRSLQEAARDPRAAFENRYKRYR